MASPTYPSIEPVRQLAWGELPVDGQTAPPEAPPVAAQNPEAPEAVVPTEPLGLSPEDVVALQERQRVMGQAQHERQEEQAGYLQTAMTGLGDEDLIKKFVSKALAEPSAPGIRETLHQYPSLAGLVTIQAQARTGHVYDTPDAFYQNYVKHVAGTRALANRAKAAAAMSAPPTGTIQTDLDGEPITAPIVNAQTTQAFIQAHPNSPQAAIMGAAQSLTQSGMGNQLTAVAQMSTAQKSAAQMRPAAVHAFLGWEKPGRVQDIRVLTDRALDGRIGLDRRNYREAFRVYHFDILRQKEGLSTVTISKADWDRINVEAERKAEQDVQRITHAGFGTLMVDSHPDDARDSIDWYYKELRPIRAIFSRPEQQLVEGVGPPQILRGRGWMSWFDGGFARSVGSWLTMEYVPGQDQSWGSEAHLDREAWYDADPDLMHRTGVWAADQLSQLLNEPSIKDDPWTQSVFGFALYAPFMFLDMDVVTGGLLSGASTWRALKGAVRGTKQLDLFSGAYLADRAAEETLGAMGQVDKIIDAQKTGGVDVQARLSDIIGELREGAPDVAQMIEIEYANNLARRAVDRGATWPGARHANMNTAEDLRQSYPDLANTIETKTQEIQTILDEQEKLLQGILVENKEKLELLWAEGLKKTAAAQEDGTRAVEMARGEAKAQFEQAKMEAKKVDAEAKAIHDARIGEAIGKYQTSLEDMLVTTLVRGRPKEEAEKLLQVARAEAEAMVRGERVRENVDRLGKDARAADKKIVSALGRTWAKRIEEADRIEEAFLETVELLARMHVTKTGGTAEDIRKAELAFIMLPPNDLVRLVKALAQEEAAALAQKLKQTTKGPDQATAAAESSVRLTILGDVGKLAARLDNLESRLAASQVMFKHESKAATAEAVAKGEAKGQVRLEKGEKQVAAAQKDRQKLYDNFRAKQKSLKEIRQTRQRILRDKYEVNRKKVAAEVVRGTRATAAAQKARGKDVLTTGSKAALDLQAQEQTAQKAQDVLAKGADAQRIKTARKLIKAQAASDLVEEMPKILREVLEKYEEAYRLAADGLRQGMRVGSEELADLAGARGALGPKLWEETGISFLRAGSWSWRNWVATVHQTIHKMGNTFDATRSALGDSFPVQVQAITKRVLQLQDYTDGAIGQIRQMFSEDDILYVRELERFLNGGAVKLRRDVSIFSQSPETPWEQFLRYVRGDAQGVADGTNIAFEAVLKAFVPAGRLGTELTKIQRRNVVKLLGIGVENPEAIIQGDAIKKIKDAVGFVYSAKEDLGRAHTIFTKGVLFGSHNTDLLRELHKFQGPHFTTEQAQAVTLFLNRLESGRGVEAYSPFDAEEMWSALLKWEYTPQIDRLPQELRHVESVARTFVQVSTDATLANYMPATLKKAIDDSVGRIVKETYGTPQQLGGGEKLMALIRATSRVWRTSAVAGYIVLKPGRIVRVFAGEVGQLWTEQGVTKAGKLSFQSSLGYLPLFGTALQDRSARLARAGRSNTHPSLFEAIFNPDLDRVFDQDPNYWVVFAGEKLNGHQLHRQMVEDQVYDTIIQSDLLHAMRRRPTGKVTSFLHQTQRRYGNYLDIYKDYYTHAQSRQRALTYLSARREGKTRLEAQKMMLDAHYDWKFAGTQFELAYINALIPFYSYFRNAEKQFLNTLLEPFTLSSAEVTKRALTGRLKIQRTRQQVVTSKVFPDWWWWENQDDLRDDEAQAAYGAKNVFPWWVGAQPVVTRAIPEWKANLYKESTGMEMTHEVNTYPQQTALDMVYWNGMLAQVVAGWALSQTGDTAGLPLGGVDRIIDEFTDLSGPILSGLISAGAGIASDDRLVGINSSQYAALRRLGLDEDSPGLAVIWNEGDRPRATPVAKLLLEAIPVLSTEILPVYRDIANPMWQAGRKEGAIHMTQRLMSVHKPVPYSPERQQESSLRHKDAAAKQRVRALRDQAEGRKPR